MKKLLLVFGLAFALVGCRNPTSPYEKFEVGEVINYRGNILVVAQITDDCVHAIAQDRSGMITGLRIGIIPTNQDYVVGEMIRKGKYEYVGPYTYATVESDVNKGLRTNTIRLFKELPEK